MAIDTYDGLKTAVGDWMARGDLAGSAADFITLGEARLNRELNPVETDISLTGTADSRSIDISTYSVVEPIALFLARAGQDETPLTRKQDGTFPYRSEEGEPRFWAMDGTNIDFDCLLDQAYPLRFRAKQRFALSGASPTNWLLTNHPDVYLAAALVWSGLFITDGPIASQWQAVLNDGIPSVRNTIAQMNRSVLGVDAALMAVGRRRWDGDWYYR